MENDDDIMAQVFAAFCEEQAEHRAAIASLLLEMEQHPDHPDDRALVDQLFRAAHSLKGSARAAGLPGIERIAHAIEDLFAALRQRRLRVTPALCDPVYAALDVIGVLVDRAIAHHPPDDALIETTVHRLRAVLAQPPSEQELAERTEGAAIPGDETPVVSAGLAVPPGVGEVTTVRLAIEVLDTLLNDVGELMTGVMRIRAQARRIQDLSGMSAPWKRLWRQVRPLVAQYQARSDAFHPVVHHLDIRPITPERSGDGLQQRDLQQLAGALTRAAALIDEIDQQLTACARDLAADQSMLSAVTDRLHLQIRRARMLPLRTIFQPLRLVARDVSRSAGKPVDLFFDDGGAEADRQVLDTLREVLTHLLRNAIDHGIEEATVRQHRGKPERGAVRLNATVDGDWLTIEVADDGAGLDDEAIRRRALELGLLTATDLERLTPTDIANLIFLPGFSTRTTASHLSGRGVGLDIVHSHIERMQGRIQVHSAPGAGCRFVLSVPVSLTSAHGLLVKLGQHTCAVPLESIQRIVAVQPGDVRVLEGRTVVLVDGRPVVLVHLADLMEAGDGMGSFSRGGERRPALLLGSGSERQVACLVDGVVGEQELVVHRLPFPIRRVQFIAAAAILPDGAIAPILDTVDIVRVASGAQRLPAPATPDVNQERRIPQILVVDDSLTTRMLEKNILEAAGYQVHLATDGVEALDVLQRLSTNGGCDLVISDIDMPRLNGFELTEKLRAGERFKHLPVVLVTSLDAPEHRERGVTVGADAYIVKRAFDQQTLLDTIARLI
ncbi:hybrid sensor histidine kinase/response regulator [Roseiflexus sp.]